MILIFDGECEFCRNCVQWIQSRVQLKAIPYQEADLTQHMLSEKEAQESVQLVLADRTLSGADAVAYLLRQTRWRLLGHFISWIAPLSRVAYHWVANNRNSAVVRLLNALLARTSGQGH